MDGRTSSILAATALCLAWPAAAQQSAPAPAQQSAKPQVEEAAAPQTPETAAEPAELTVQLAERGDTAKPPVAKRARVARVSSCRCGDLSSQD